MPEEQNFQGELWTDQCITILNKIGWKQRGTSNFDIPCSKKSMHGKNGGKRKNDHGIDILFNYNDPYYNENKGIIIEAKRRKWNGINTSEIQKWVKQLLKNLECGETADKIQKYGFDSSNTGLLMIWCHEFNKYDKMKMQNYLAGIELKNKRSPYKIYVAGNDKILKWCSLIEFIEKEKQKDSVHEFKFLYPSDYFLDEQSSSLVKNNTLNLIHMFSKYIFAKSTELVEVYNNTQKINVTHIFMDDEPNLKELNFMYELIKMYQLEDAEKIVIHFYGEKHDYRGYVEDFIRRINSKYNSLDGVDRKIISHYITLLSDIPTNYSEV